MVGEVITKEKHPDIYKWLLENVDDYKNKQYYYTLTEKNKINTYCNIIIKDTTREIKYPFGYVEGYFSYNNCKDLISLFGSPEEVGGYFSCFDCKKITSLIGSPKIVEDNFNCNGCYKLTSLIGLPKVIKGIFWINDTLFSNNPSEKQKYNKYIDMWFELLESVSDDDRCVYINNYKDKTDAFYNHPIIPKEVMNKYKIDFLLKELNYES